RRNGHLGATVRMRHERVARLGLVDPDAEAGVQGAGHTHEVSVKGPMPRLVKPETCDRCLGREWSPWFSASEGHGTLGVLLVGEALGQHEEQDGLPFRPQAQAGSLLERAFKRLGYDRSQFRITNIVRCRPPNDYLSGAPYEFQVIQHCRQYLDDELRT